MPAPALLNMFAAHSAATGSWTPADLPDVVARWKGDDGVTGGASVSAWLDSVSGISLAQATSGNRPDGTANTLNGHATITFDGSDDYLAVSSVATFNFLHQSASTILVVINELANPNGSTDNYWFGTTDADGAGRGPGWVFQRYLKQGRIAGASAVADSSAISYTQAAWHDVVFVNDPTNGTAADRIAIYVDGGSAVKGNAATASTSASDSYASFRVGGGTIHNNRSSNIAVAELVIMSSLITPTDQGFWASYIASEYGL